MATLVELTTLITAWGEARGIVANSTPFAQACKTHEELRELVEAHALIEARVGAHAELQDAIGDVYVTLVMVCACNGTPINGFEYDGRDASKNPSAVVDLYECVPLLFQACAIAGGSRESSQTVHLEVVSMIGWLRDVCEFYGVTLTECVEQAYGEIQHRTGYLRQDGIFVKEESCQ